MHHIQSEWDRNVYWELELDIDSESVFPKKLWRGDGGEILEVELTDYPETVDWLCERAREDWDNAIDPDEIRADLERDRVRDYNAYESPKGDVS